MVLRHAYCELEEKQTADKIRKLQQRLNSWEIKEQEYEEKYETLMQDYRLKVSNIIN